MFKKYMLLIVSGILMLNLCGCFAIVAGVAGGAGTAVWLSGKLTQEFHAPYKETIDATKRTIESMHLSLVKETQEENVTQFKGSYTDGREMWIDVRKISENSTKVEVRIGGVRSDKAAASAMLRKIQGNL